MTIIYVDNLIILANNIARLKWPKSELEKEFEMWSQSVALLPRSEFERNRETRIITMIQRNYVKEVLKHSNMKEYKTVTIIFYANLKL
jgi:hypothetical protein